MYSYMQPYTFCCKKKKMHKKRSDEEEIILKKYDLCISRVRNYFKKTSSYRALEEILIYYNTR